MNVVNCSKRGGYCACGIGYCGEDARAYGGGGDKVRHLAANLATETAAEQKRKHLRDYFAANAPEAPAGFERKWISQTEVEPIEKSIARWNYAYADAMLAAREAK